MISQWKRALAACAFAVFAPLTIAQSISVPGSSLAAGSTITGSFSDSAQAGKIVDIVIGNNLPFPLYEEVVIPIKLDSEGRGSFKWTVTNSWDVASFSGGGATEVVKIIN
ncbi:MAG: hypothetical protein ACI85K_001945 [Hyphomicrobiaceae bacterium]|jgi:hypothetical protein